MELQIRLCMKTLIVLLLIAFSGSAFSEDAAVEPLLNGNNIETGSKPAEESTNKDDPCRELKKEIRKLKKQKTVRFKRKKIIKRDGKVVRKLSKVNTNKSKNIPPDSKVEGKNICTGSIPVSKVQEILSTSRDFSGMNLNCLDLSGYDLSKADFSGATLLKSNLSRASLKESRLERTDFTNADMRSSSLHLAGGHGTVYTGAMLANALWMDNRQCGEGSLGRCLDNFDTHAKGVKQ